MLYVGWIRFPGSDWRYATAENTRQECVRFMREMAGKYRHCDVLVLPAGKWPMDQKASGAPLFDLMTAGP